MIDNVGDPSLDVAIGVLCRKDGSFLLSRRLSWKFYGGFWEFPGGKIEIGEAPKDALRRELYEELGIHALDISSNELVTYCYTDVTVRLHVFFVLTWSGIPTAQEGQALCWQTLEITITPVLPATLLVIDSCVRNFFQKKSYFGELN